jgi:hypothetical protein
LQRLGVRIDSGVEVIDLRDDSELYMQRRGERAATIVAD